MKMPDQVYVEEVKQYRCKSCGMVVLVEYPETSWSEELRDEYLERSIKSHNWIEHGKE